MDESVSNCPMSWFSRSALALNPSRWIAMVGSASPRDNSRATLRRASGERSSWETSRSRSRCASPATQPLGHVIEVVDQGMKFVALKHPGRRRRLLHARGQFPWANSRAAFRRRITGRVNRSTSTNVVAPPTQWQPAIAERQNEADLRTSDGAGLDARGRSIYSDICYPISK